MKQQIDTIIFDLDGTLLDTLEDLWDCVNYALKKCGFPERKKSEVRRSIGGGASVLVQQSVPEGVDKEEIEKCKDIFLQHYKLHANDKTKLYSGIAELIHTLKNAGYKLGVVSSKGDALVKELVKSYFGNDILVALGDAVDIRRKPAPDSVEKAIQVMKSQKEKAIYVGDSEVDIETARNADISCISVTWGFRDREELEALSPDYIVDSVEKLEEIFI